MNEFSFGRAAARIILLLLSFFLIISALAQFHGFLKSTRVKVMNKKVALYPVYTTAKGSVVFIAKPVYALMDGKIERLVGNYSFVNKGDVVGRVVNNEYTVDLVTPSSGLIVWGKFNKYIGSIQNFLKSPFKIQFDWNKGFVHKNEIVCSIINNDNFFVSLEGHYKQQIVYIYLNGITFPLHWMYTGKGYAIFSGNEFLKYFINKNTFEILNGFKKGVKIKTSTVAVCNGKKGIFIVENGIIKFLPAEMYRLHGGYLLANVNVEETTLIVVETPHLVKENEIFNE